MKLNDKKSQSILFGLCMALFSFITEIKGNTKVPAPVTKNVAHVSQPWFAQIWNESFSDLANGASSDTGATAWSTTITQGTIETQSGLLFFGGTNSGSNATWVSEDIDISNHSNISISYIVADALIGQKETSDYVRGFYVLDNGTRVQFANITDDVPTPTLQEINGLNGSTLRIEIDFRVSYGNETFSVDDILVEGTALGDTQSPNPPTLISTGQTGTNVSLSWSGATDNIGVTGYNVYQDGASILNNLSGTSTQISGLTEATAYAFHVRALDAAGNQSVNSNTVNVSTDSGSSPPTDASVWSGGVGGDIYYNSGNVGIGRTSVPNGYSLAVDGNVRAREVRVDQDNWPDYVFSEDYELPTLKEIKKYIQENGHLPNIPSAKEVAKEGIQLGEMNKLLLEKIEELTLYMIALKKKERLLNKELEKLDSELQLLEGKLKQ